MRVIFFEEQSCGQLTTRSSPPTQTDLPHITECECLVPLGEGWAQDPQSRGTAPGPGAASGGEPFRSYVRPQGRDPAGHR